MNYYIKRQDVLDLIDSKDPNYEVRHFKEDVECLPPVKDIDRAFQALNDITIVSRALYYITNMECCDYGFPLACDIAEKYVNESEEDVK